MLNHKRLLIIMLLTVLCLSTGIIATNAQGEVTGTTISQLNVRTGPGSENAAITQIPANTSVLIEGRNSIGNWILIHTPDVVIRGWVASLYVAFGGDEVLAAIPVTNEIIGAAPAADENAPPPATDADSVMLPGVAQGIAISTLNVRTGPGIETTTITQITSRSTAIVEGRNNIGDWLLIHSTDNAIRGWVASRYVALDEGVNLSDLPVVSEQIGDSAAPVVADTAGTEGTEFDVPPVPEDAVASMSPGSAQGTVEANLNVRIGPGSEHEAFAQFPVGTVVLVEARNAFGDWILVHTTDAATRGWIAAFYVTLTSGVTMDRLPPSEEIMGQAPAPVVEDEPNFDLPSGTTDQMLARLRNLPVLHNFNSGTVHRTFQEGQYLGNRRDVFMKVGDSVTAVQPFLIGFGNGNYNLGSYGHLQATIDFFSRTPPRAGVANSFVNNSYAARSGFTSISIFDGMWVDPGLCYEAPLYCEYDQTRPAVAVAMFGPIDMQRTSAEVFQANMWRLAGDLMDRGVIAVTTTFPSHPNFRWEESLLFNTIMLDVAAYYDMPVINLWRAAQDLPNNGLREGEYVHLSQGDTFFDFNGNENLYGLDLRNLLTLQMLHELRRYVLTTY